ncbi:hypothetical protein [Herbihabitans rhizosphaerae]|uniref:hypothetical protein n=1 Tax=Herbihabitans rhizosphaerae TaxID=1872711 RepID=UPI00102CB43C|nr:hypothetical protein [Herbihabitans rhizosphaerae]
MLTAAGCGNRTEPPAAPAETSADAQPGADLTTTPSKALATNARGNLPKKIGEESGFSDREGGHFATFKLTKIEKSAKCADASIKPSNGQFMVLTFEIATTAEFSTRSTPSLFNPLDFSVLGLNGVADTEVATPGTYGCRAAKKLPYNLAPSSKYVFEIVLDTKATSGAVQYRPPLAADYGWEWQL